MSDKSLLDRLTDVTAENTKLQRTNTLLRKLLAEAMEYDWNSQDGDDVIPADLLNTIGVALEDAGGYALGRMRVEFQNLDSVNGNAEFVVGDFSGEMPYTRADTIADLIDNISRLVAASVMNDAKARLGD